jgi:NAD(P)-dependent dehydrogenase (short-subunit alcohol dehydrogenase family)
VLIERTTIMQLNGSSAIVTGGASGLGAATARALAARGAEVFALDLPAAIAAAPAVDGVTFVATDVTDADQVRAAVQTAGAGAALRTVVNCAGIAPSARVLGRSGVHDPALFDTVIRVNLLGTFLVMSTAAEVIAQQTPDAQGQRGVVVNTASIAAYDGQVGQVAYAASKSAVVGMTLPAARDLASPRTASASAPSPPASSTLRCWRRSATSTAPISPRAFPSRSGCAIRSSMRSW